MKIARMFSMGDLPFHGVFRLCMCESSGFSCNDRVALTYLDKSDFHKILFYSILSICPYQAKRTEARRLRVRSAKDEVAPKFMDSMSSMHISLPRVLEASLVYTSLFDLSKQSA